jgi:hypothetical protein
MCIILLNQDEYKRAYKSSNSPIHIRPGRCSVRTFEKRQKGSNRSRNPTRPTNPLHNRLIEPSAEHKVSAKQLQLMLHQLPDHLKNNPAHIPLLIGPLKTNLQPLLPQVKQPSVIPHQKPLRTYLGLTRPGWQEMETRFVHAHCLVVWL